MIPTIQDQPIVTEQSAQIPSVQSKGSNLLLLILFIVVAAVAGFIGYELGTRAQESSTDGSVVNPPVEEGVACTFEAKICPDGSSVGRMPPNCEFAACPSGETMLYEAESYSFEYPKGWTISSIEPVSKQVKFSNNSSTNSHLTVEHFEYKDFVNQLYKQPDTNTLKDQIAEVVAYETSSTATLGDRCPEVGEWIPVNETEMVGFIVPITLKCPYGNEPPIVGMWSFIKHGESIIWISEDGVGEVPATQTVIDTLVFK